MTMPFAFTEDRLVRQADEAILNPTSQTDAMKPTI